VGNSQVKLALEEGSRDIVAAELNKEQVVVLDGVGYDGGDGEEEKMVVTGGGVGGGSLVAPEEFCSMAHRRAAMRSKEWSGRNLSFVALAAVTPHSDRMSLTQFSIVMLTSPATVKSKVIPI